MKIKVIQAIKLVASFLIERGNKPATTTDMYKRFSGDISLQDIHYAVRIMTKNRHLSRIKHSTYVLTDSTKPIDYYVTFKKKARKPRKKAETVQPQQITLQEQVQKWDEEEAKVTVDFQELCEKLQNALAKSYVECDLLEATVAEQRSIIKYLEGKLRETTTV